MTSPDTSAQDAPGASQEAKQRIAEAYLELRRACAAFSLAPGARAGRRIDDANDAYVATIRASERERYAALVESVRALHNGHGGTICYSACHALAALEEE